MFHTTAQKTQIYSPIEFNILCDPEAAQIVIDTDIPKVVVRSTMCLDIRLNPALFFVKGYDTLERNASCHIDG